MAVLSPTSHGTRTRTSCSAPHEPRVEGVVTEDRATARLTAALSAATSSHGGGGSDGPEGPSARMTAWTWTRPRRWNSTTFMYESRATERIWRSFIPAARPASR